MIVMRR